MGMHKLVHRTSQNQTLKVTQMGSVSNEPIAKFSQKVSSMGFWVANSSVCLYARDLKFFCQEKI